MKLNISKKIRVICLIIFLLSSFFLLIYFSRTIEIDAQKIENNDIEILTSPVLIKGAGFDIEVEPESFSVLIKTKDGYSAYVSKSTNKSTISDLKLNNEVVSWVYPDKGIRVILELKDDYLRVDIFSENVNSFTWPAITDNVVAYTLPWHQGKYIPAKDPKWIEFWNYHGAISGSGGLSMQFMGVNYANFALVYIIKNMFNNELKLDGDTSLNLSFTHEFPATVKEKHYGFQIYLRSNSPVEIAKTYKDYIVSKDKFISLEEKALQNPNIRKLYGAPFIYLWGNEFLIRENVQNWDMLIERFLYELSDSKLTLSKNILNIINGNDSGKEFVEILNGLKAPFELNNYIKNVFIRAFNDALTSRNFCTKALLEQAELDANAKALLAKDLEQLSQLELYYLNKSLFYSSFSKYLDPVSEWGNGTSQYVLDKLIEMGIFKVWLGLESFQPAYMHPEFISNANNLGYLVGPYDSYHSIHAPGKEMWETAKFQDTTLFNNATIKNKNGKYITGFLGEGRKLNPTLSLPAVKNRLNDILSNGFKFNSWFIDCDATGEIFDDYTSDRMTSQSEDLDARLARMAWISDSKNMVIGSEGGNDFTATTIAFAHGLDTPGFVWQDLDWRSNKDSKYYFGPYFAPEGGVPIHFTKQVPVKELYHYAFFDCRFNLPLFQLVYNNSVITSHHWGFGSLKFSDEIKNNKLREILFNFPPLYNLDRRWISKYQNTISSHIAVFAKTHSRAVKLEMTSFDWLTNDKLVQRTQFEDALEIVANFGEKPYQYKTEIIPAMSLLIIYNDLNKKEIYSPIQ